VVLKWHHRDRLRLALLEVWPGVAMVAHFSADILLHLVGPLFASHVYKKVQNT